jgi:ankyrin repeat protein
MEELFIAVKNGNLDMVKELLGNGANPNVRGKNGEAPLHWASIKGHLLIVQELLNEGAEVNIQDDSRKATPLHAAAFGKHISVVRELLNRGANPNKRDYLEQTPLEIAKIGNNLKLVTLLKQHMKANDWEIMEAKQ